MIVLVSEEPGGCKEMNEMEGEGSTDTMLVFQISC